MKSPLIHGIPLCAFSVIALAANLVQAADYPAAHMSSPEQYQLLLENEQVLVLKMTLKPGESDLMHSHRDESVYFARGGKLRIQEANGELIEATVPDGHVMWHRAWSHQVTNAGSTDVVAIIVEEK
nr:hypothetical protein [Oceanococcus sp. HetDA_MAG_MS8]